ncbi:MAG: hypothetical protein PW786_04340 [Arachidicoccus sp.]|nr:hypothetical protein [Arachidicoccus sp.]
MKTNKNRLKAIVALLALVLVTVVVFAKTTTNYFHYTGSETTLSDYQNEDNWERTSSPSAPGCTGTGKPCVVCSTEDNVSDFVASILSISDVTSNTVAMQN